jgi:hypothetical protein
VRMGRPQASAAAKSNPAQASGDKPAGGSPPGQPHKPS